MTRTVRTPGGGTVTDHGIKVEANHKWHADLGGPNGRHLWVIVSVWAIAEPARDQHLLDVENLLTVEGPGCFWCEQTWSPTIGSKCPGDHSWRPRQQTPEHRPERVGVEMTNVS